MKEYLPLIPTQSAASDITSGPILMGDATMLSIHAVFTGVDVVGTLTIQGSNTGADFVALATATNVTASTNTIVSNTSVTTKYARVFWDATSGTGNITISGIVKHPAVTAAQNY